MFVHGAASIGQGDRTARSRGRARSDPTIAILHRSIAARIRQTARNRRRARRPSLAHANIIRPSRPSSLRAAAPKWSSRRWRSRSRRAGSTRSLWWVRDGRARTGPTNSSTCPRCRAARFEHWPKLPFFRHEFMYEELTFAAGLAMHSGCRTSGPNNDLQLSLHELGVAPSALRKGCASAYFRNPERRLGGRRPGLEPRSFSCDGLICTNPLYYERNRAALASTLIPNGVDPARFNPGRSARPNSGCRPSGQWC